VTEAYLKGRLVRAFREDLPGCVVFRHEDMRTAGIPDISVTWHGRTRWIEVKLDRPGSRSKVTAIQRLTLERLQGYLLVYGQPFGKTTRLIRNGLMEAWSGFAHQAVVATVRRSIELEEKTP
jgi:hypothetical protein